jgi:hypothetical protein
MSAGASVPLRRLDGWLNLHHWKSAFAGLKKTGQLAQGSSGEETLGLIVAFMRGVARIPRVGDVDFRGKR